MDRVLVVSHDAGGAELLSSWVKYNQNLQFTYMLAGPAIEIFKKKLPGIKVNSPELLPHLAKNQDLILTSTSWLSDIERQAILWGKENSIKTITYLDHWCYYEQRFLYSDKLTLPDEIWVSDQYALEIAKNIFPLEITLVENYYFYEMKLEIDALKLPSRKDKRLRLLYICEPIAEYAEKQFGSRNYFNYTEFEALNYFFCSINSASYKQDIDIIRIRLHPSEPKEKYNELISYVQSPLLMISDEPLLKDILWADWIVGCSSMVLVQGLLANKKVFTNIPPKASAFKLPHKEIQILPK